MSTKARLAPVSRRLSPLLAALAVCGLVVAACAPTPVPATQPPQRAAKPGAPAAKPAESAPAAQPATAPASGVDPAAFYAGKTIRVIVATTAGSAFDLYARTLARHMPKYLPGSPTMIVENMPGAAHLIGANYLYNVAEKDGTVIGTFVETQVLNQVIGGKGVEFDALRFNWVGAATTVEQACLVRTDTPARITDFRELLPPTSKRAVFATPGAGGSGYEYSMLFKEVLGANLRLVTGYPGNQEVRLAIEQGEADGYCASWDAVDRGMQPWIEAGTPPFKVIAQEGVDKIATLPDVPVAHDFARTDEDKQLFRLANAPGGFAKPYTAPPGTPSDRVAALRDAFMATWRDPQAQEELARGHVSLNPRTGAQVQALIQELTQTPKPLLDRYADVVR
jgi:tripartite-type tricarboxylate transporter receptor subunit TctC